MTFGLLALVVAAGPAGPLLAGLPRLGAPLMVGEIAAGVLLGRTGLGWIDPVEPTAAFLSGVGFAMLMFVVCTRPPLRDAGMRGALRPAALATVVLLALAVPAGFVRTALGPDRPLVLAVVVATSSAAIAIPVLHGLGPDVPAATFATAWVTLTDVVTVLAVPVVLATGALGNVLAGGGLVLLAGGVAFLLIGRLRRSAPGHALRHLSKRRGWALDLRVGLTVHVLVAVVLRRPPAVGLLATAALGVPSAVVSIGLAQQERGPSAAPTGP